MCHRVHHDVDADRVAPWREFVEESRVLTFAFPRVGDVGVMRHHDHDVAVLVGNGTEIRRGALAPAFGGGAAVRTPELDRGYLRQLVHLELRAKDWVAQRHVVDRVLRRWEHTTNLRNPVVPGFLTPV